jgi:ribonuclease Z
LYIRYGAKGADEVLSNIQCIWISHIHADHHSGLPRVLSARRKLVQNCSTTCPILVIGPRQLKRFLDAYALVEELDMVFLDSSQTTAVAEKAAEELTMKEACNHQAILESTIKRKDQGFHFQQGVDVAGRHILKQVMHKMGLKSCLSVQVVHCLNAYGVVLESETKQEDGGNVKPGWKLVYSGDTRPCEAMVEASAGATVLIHEVNISLMLF